MNILERILERTRADLAERKRRYTRAYLESMPYFGGPILDLERALRQNGPMALIAEIKPASPSAGRIRSAPDVVSIATSYRLAGAAALSVLTEEPFFGGSLENLRRIRPWVDVPLIRKDFIIDEFQLYEARAFGADAVLLIASILDRYQLQDLLQAARGLGLGVLLELYSQEELERVDFDAVRLIGVNNRDLRTFAVDLRHSVEILAHVPTHVLKVSESGIRSADDLWFLYQHNVEAALIGESLMRAPDPGEALYRLRHDFYERLRQTSAESLRHYVLG
ncbi:MAG: indole-3-glycerol phosphate synthase TrpC [Bacteroidetes bacterium]|nr:indole-3-glycerol phosphate synthase TrpC [Rhodothermia bacterium]MCS7155036.1 indole-3-glycerol phosphate synthase TrpC [Bacteroidota bacterium]MCX7907320.1 indole-3-glycerol phosphate synthase TrpC [Bacteroidota bacterium]MDW8137953.1 indole-3-glycerol phosphate synthase TrpC [Bacteroidota bacterium]MDW8286195.1 indole-3-glycerol phosphate synthase TrpC [Bacteroidota bacterium]